MSNSTQENDWRLDNCDHLEGVMFIYKKWEQWSPTWDHDHCGGCWATFSNYDSEVEKIWKEGYANVEFVDEENEKFKEGYFWICPTCFQDLKDVMNWVDVSKN